MTAVSPQKINSLESLRGLAALSVVLCHTVQLFWPEVRIGQGAPLTSLWHNGGFAVRLFFVLSGFVLALSYCRTRDAQQLKSSAARRYFRLYIPAAASIAFAYLLHVCGAFESLNAAKGIPGQSDWIRNLYSSGPSLRLAVREALLGPFLDYQFMKYNEVLWTMGVELKGSMLVFAALALCGSARHRWLIYGVLIYALDSWQLRYAVDFACGMALSDWHCNHQAQARTSWLWLAVFVLGACLGDLQTAWVAENGTASMIRGSRWWPTLAALLLVLSSVRSSHVERALSAPPLVWLGEVSFALYLFHLPIICSIGGWIFRGLMLGGLGNYWSAMIASVVAVAASLAVAPIGPLLLDPLAIRVGRWIEHQLYPVTVTSEPSPVLHSPPVPVVAK